MTLPLTGLFALIALTDEESHIPVGRSLFLLALHALAFAVLVRIIPRLWPFETKQG